MPHPADPLLVLDRDGPRLDAIGNAQLGINRLNQRPDLGFADFETIDDGVVAATVSEHLDLTVCRKGI